MSWIEDVRNEIKALDTSPKKLRGFGLTVGIAFVLLGVWFFWKGVEPWWIVFGLLGIILGITGLIIPKILPGVYRVWMGFAFAIGWMISRTILGLLFYLVITPVGLVARLMGKQFMDINLRKQKDSYWIEREKIERDKYEKMY